MSSEEHLQHIIENAFQALAAISGEPLREVVLAFVQAYTESFRPISPQEWEMLKRQDEVVHEARRLSNATGAINTTRLLDQALKRYDEAYEAFRALPSLGQPQAAVPPPGSASVSSSGENTK